MAMGRRRAKQGDLWVPTQELPHSPGHPFYRKLNAVLAEAGFDAFVEELCQPHYAKHQGRPSIPPGTYFRMLFVGYFEGLDSQRGIAWRCSDSRSLQEFLGCLPTQTTPDHSSLTVIRQRLPEVVHEQVFAFVLALAGKHGLLKGTTVATDATFLEANAAMKSIERKDTREDYKEYLRRLAQEAGIEDPSDEELRRFDKKRPNKKVSNEEWQSGTDPDSRIAKMKDGTTHLAYKAEHVVDLDTNLILSAEIYHADQGDAETLVPSVATAQLNMVRAGSEAEIAEAVADKGYHKAQTLADCEALGWRTYIPESKRHRRRRWYDKPVAQQQAFRANRRRLAGARSKRLQRRRSEYVERSFAHLCETGGARRSWLCGLVKVSKRYLMHAVAHNLGLLMRKLFGIGTPRSLQGACAGLVALMGAMIHLWFITAAWVNRWFASVSHELLPESAASAA
jgi:transposase